MHPRTCSIRKTVYDRHGGPPRVIVITLPFVDFGDEANEKGAGDKPMPVSRKRRFEPRHAFGPSPRKIRVP
jgi:hypothetical protein